MSIKKAYNSWAETYDSNANKTRDLDQIATQQILNLYKFDTVLEIGCGTGKNTVWFAEKAKKVIGIDASEEMLAKAKAKIQSSKVEFLLADLKKPWQIEDNFAELISCNLVLEHFSDLDFIFKQAYKKLKKKGKFFICELHPFKQYTGSQARFETPSGIQKVECFTHHTSDFTQNAINNGFKLLQLNEWFDDNDDTKTPRLISFVFEK